jgi:hypothetical protein
MSHNKYGSSSLKIRGRVHFARSPELSPGWGLRDSQTLLSIVPSEFYSTTPLMHPTISLFRRFVMTVTTLATSSTFLTFFRPTLRGYFWLALASFCCRHRRQMNMSSSTSPSGSPDVEGRLTPSMNGNQEFPARRSLVSQAGLSHWDVCSCWRDLILMISLLNKPSSSDISYGVTAIKKVLPSSSITEKRKNYCKCGVGNLHRHERWQKLYCRRWARQPCKR